MDNENISSQSKPDVIIEKLQWEKPTITKVDCLAPEKESASTESSTLGLAS